MSARVLVGVAAVTAAAGTLRYLTGAPEVIAFIVAGIALAGQAWIISEATETTGRYLGTALTGTLQSTVGNLPELFVVIFALEAGDRVVAQTALLGSILVNALLLLGLVLIAGSLVAPDKTMRFSARLPNDTATLLLVASFIIVLLGLDRSSGNNASHHAHDISIVGAIVLLGLYATWLRQYLITHPEGGGGSDHRRLDAAAVAPVALLLGAGAASAFTADWFVHALEPTIRQLGISRAFAGLVIVAIAGNAVEHVVAILLAVRGRSELAISVVKSSVSQVATMLFPAAVLISLALRTQLSFELAPVYTGALIGTAILVWQITGDGEATPFEGAALCATFVALGTVAWFG